MKMRLRGDIKIQNFLCMRFWSEQKRQRTFNQWRGFVLGNLLFFVFLTKEKTPITHIGRKERFPNANA
jgi:hypothetical protein